MDTATGSLRNGRSSVEPWYCCLHSLLLLGRITRWFGDALWLCRLMCFAVFAVGFVVFATLLWAHGTSHAGAAGAVSQVGWLLREVSLYPRLCQAAEGGNAPPS